MVAEPRIELGISCAQDTRHATWLPRYFFVNTVSDVPPLAINTLVHVERRAGFGRHPERSNARRMLMSILDLAIARTRFVALTAPRESDLHKWNSGSDSN